MTNEKGVGLIELLISVFIFVFGLLAIFGIQNRTILETVESDMYLKAISLNDQLINFMRANREQVYENTEHSYFYEGINESNPIFDAGEIKNSTATCGNLGNTEDEDSNKKFLGCWHAKVKKLGFSVSTIKTQDDGQSVLLILAWKDRADSCFTANEEYKDYCLFKVSTDL